MSKNQQEQPSEWDDCPPGLLTGYAGKMHRRQLLVLAAKTAAATGGVAVVGFAAWFEILRRQEFDQQYFGLACSDVRKLILTYRAGQLEAQRSKVLEQHVRRCSRCAEFRPQLREATG